jgi:nucleoside-diphosphate-sugar epimerase
VKIAITGGAGCLGSNLVEHWLPRGHEILVVDNFATGKREVVPRISGLQVLEGDVAAPGLLERAFREFEPEVVVHAAASYKDPNDWAGDARTNVGGSIAVARASEATGVRRLVNFQTTLCYGRPHRIPVPVDHRLAPFTSYGLSKAAGEGYLLMAKVPVMSLRIANVTGPRLAIGPIPTFYKRLQAGQKCFVSDAVRDFLDMADFTAFMDLALAEGAPSGVFNVSSGEGHSIQEVFDEVAAYLDKRPSEPVPVVPVGADDVPAMVLDPSLTQKSLGWRAKVAFRELMRAQLDWYRAHGVSEIHSHLQAHAR